jgi:hypothetical protein
LGLRHLGQCAKCEDLLGGFAGPGWTICESVRHDKLAARPRTRSTFGLQKDIFWRSQGETL